MARKEKEKVEIFEKNPEFSSPSEAQEAYKKADFKFKFSIVCSAIAALGSIVWLLSKTPVYAHPVGMEICDAILKISLVTMLICTNINYIKYLWKAIKFTWFIVPIFPIDLFFCIFGAAAFFALSLFVPALPCLMTLYQAYINRKEARKYLSCAGGVTVTEYSDEDE